MTCSVGRCRVPCAFSSRDEKVEPFNVNSTVNWVVYDDMFGNHLRISDIEGASPYCLRSVKEICVPKSVQVIPDQCFCSHLNLFRITFAPGSRLEKIGFMAFGSKDGHGCPIQEIHIPDSVTEIGQGCFYNCKHLSSVAFGFDSKLQLIGRGAFSGTSERACPIRHFFVPNSVRKIGGWCFYNCARLSDIRFGSSPKLEKIGGRAFSGKCQKTIRWRDSYYGYEGDYPEPDDDFPRYKATVNRHHFLDCDSDCEDYYEYLDGEYLDGGYDGMGCPLQEIFIPDSVRIIGTRCFYNCRELHRVVFGMSSSLEFIGVDAFSGSRWEQAHDEMSGCPLREITIPPKVVELGKRCFCKCTKLEKVNFSPSSSLEIIGEEAFAGDKEGGCALTEISIPDSVREIGTRCFYKCTKLERVNFPPSSCLENFWSGAFAGCAIQEICIPDKVKAIGDYCFCECPNLSRVIFSPQSSLKSIGSSAFSHNSRETIRDRASVKRYMATGKKLVHRGCPIREIHIPNSVTVIGSQCFYNCRELCRITFGAKSQLKKFGDRVFSGYKWIDGGDVGCPIVEIEIPEFVTELGRECFYRCHSLSLVTFGSLSSLLVIGESCFSETMIVEISIPNRVRKLERRCFYNCKRLSRVIISPSSSLTEFGQEAFSGEYDRNGDGGGCPIAEIFIPDSVKKIGDRCFYNCKRLSRVSISPSSSLKEFDNGAFSSSDAITEIFIPDSVKRIGKRCFYNCKRLSRVIISPSSSLTEFGEEAFSGECDSDGEGGACPITEIFLPDTVKIIGSRCFERCTKLEQVTFVSLPSIEVLGDDAFSMTKVEHVEERIREQAPHVTNCLYWDCREGHLFTDDEVCYDQDFDDDFDPYVNRLLGNYRHLYGGETDNGDWGECRVS